MLKPQQRLPAKWQRHASSLESVSKPMCVFFMRHHTQIFTFTDSRNIYSYIFLISTFGRKNGVGRDSVRHQLKPAAVTFIDHNTNLTPTVQLFYFHQLIYCRGVFSRQFVLCPCALLPPPREVMWQLALVCLSFCMFIGEITENNDKRQQTHLK